MPINNTYSSEYLAFNISYHLQNISLDIQLLTWVMIQSIILSCNSRLNGESLFAERKMHIGLLTIERLVTQPVFGPYVRFPGAFVIRDNEQKNQHVFSGQHKTFKNHTNPLIMIIGSIQCAFRVFMMKLSSQLMSYVFKCKQS